MRHRGSYVEIICVIDRSGSMSTILDDAMGGFNTFLAAQKEVKGRAKMTLVQFDDQYEKIYDHVDIHEVRPFTKATYIPRGSTALLDAIGKTINIERARIAHDYSYPRKVIFCLVTDGYENASKEYTRQQVINLIDTQRKNDWEFFFVCADEGQIKEGLKLGFGTSFNYNNVTYDPKKHHISGVRSMSDFAYSNKASAGYEVMASMVAHSRGADGVNAPVDEDPEDHTEE